MDFESLRIERDGGVAELILRGPGKGNALGPAFWREMPIALRALDEDASVRVVILRGDEKCFTYGLDLIGMMESMGPLITGENAASERSGLLQLIGAMQNATEGLARMKKPVIAAIHGWCIGGGIDLIAACDIRLTEKSAKFSLREVRIAIVADLGALQRLPRIIGDGHTREMAYSGADYSADDVVKMGLCNRAYDTPEVLLAAARELAKKISENPPLVVQGIKQVLEYSADKSVADGLRYTAVWNSAFLQSHDLNEAFAAFAERRPPKFQGK